MIISRRCLVTAACGTLVGYGLRATSAWAAGEFAERLGGDIARVEIESGGRLGVAVLDTLTDARFGHRADERFPLCSTFKLLAAAAVLARVDAKQEHLDRRVEFAAADVVVNSPVTKDHVGPPGMSLEELCEAAMTMSDNTAGNLLLASLGGPQGLTAYARALGDTVSRLDRIEPELNEAMPGDMRDTTTPAAMAANMRALALDKALSAVSREQLVRWLIANKTGDTRLRAGLPAGWRVGDKTGAGEHGTTNDLGVFWPPDRAPVIVSIYLTQTSASPAQRNATLAAVGRAVASALG
jgi:beta-lactamase class A